MLNYQRVFIFVKPCPGMEMTGRGADRQTDCGTAGAASGRGPQRLCGSQGNAGGRGCETTAA